MNICTKCLKEYTVVKTTCKKYIILVLLRLKWELYKQNNNVFINLGGKFMKKQVKKFISAVLASTMAVPGVAVTNFAVTPVSVLAASNIAV